MRQLLAILIIIGILLGVKQLYSYWEDVRARQAARERAGGLDEGETPGAAKPAAHAAPAIPGLPADLETSLEAARKQGASGLRAWLQVNRRRVQDPRLAEIELDYVVMSGANNFAEARRVFADVKQRTPTNSPVYSRIRKLEKSF